MREATALLIMILAFAFGHYRGWTAANDLWKDKTVKRGAAQYQVDQSGNVRWSWKELDKEEK